MNGLGTIITAMITPFDEEGSIDVAEAQRLAKWLVDRGNDGLVVAGSTGEGMALDSGERAELFHAVKSAVGNDASVIANVGSNDVRATINEVAERRLIENQPAAAAT